MAAVRGRARRPLQCGVRAAVHAGIAGSDRRGHGNGDDGGVPPRRGAIEI